MQELCLEWSPSLGVEVGLASFHPQGVQTCGQGAIVALEFSRVFGVRKQEGTGFQVSAESDSTVGGGGTLGEGRDLEEQVGWEPWLSVLGMPLKASPWAPCHHPPITLSPPPTCCALI